jgi:putative membrane protein
MRRVRISESDRQRVSAAILQAETGTSGEIIAVAARQSDDYVHAPLHLASGVALAVPLVLPLFKHFYPWSSLPLTWVFLLQLLAFILVALLFSFDWLRYLITPKSLMRRMASRNAAFQFLAINTHSTAGRTGILLFVSLLERHVEVIGDTEIAARVSQDEWQAIIDEMLPLLKEERIADALVLGIERCGELLSRNFPPGTANDNELPDHFIVLE